MKLNLKTLFAVTAAVAAATAQAGPRPPVVDSTGFRPGVVGTPIPQPIFPIGADRGGVGTNNVAPLPPGYHEVVVATGNRYLGAGEAGLAEAGYYFSIRYPTIVAANYDLARGPISLNDVVSGSAAVFGSPTAVPSGTVVAVPVGAYDVNAGWGPTQTSYFVVEPTGTRSTLVKDVGSQTITLTRADVNAYALPGTIGVNVGTATPICQARGYADFIPGTIVYTNRGNGCTGDQVTQWNGSSFVNNDACYNLVMSGLQCWK